MNSRILTIAFSFFLLPAAARPAFAGAIDFQTAVGSGASGQASQTGGGGATGSRVQSVDIGDVTGTVCDCGEITPPEGGPAPDAPKGGFPKFPLYALAAGPSVCFLGICSGSEPTPTPPPEVPEPLTLATLSVGLAALAGLRARRRRA